jgi:phage baseplate assembly protein gpV
MLSSAKKTQFGGVNEDNTARFGVLRPGIVTQIDTKRHTVKVRWLDQEIESFWLPVLKTWTGSNKHYALPDLGDQVICLTDYIQEDGIVLGSIYSDADVPPIDDQDKTHLQWADKTFMEYDRKDHVSRMINQDPGGTSLLQVGESLLYHWGNQGMPLGLAGPLAFLIGCNDVKAQLNVLIPPTEAPSQSPELQDSLAFTAAVEQAVDQVLTEKFIPIMSVSLRTHTHSNYGSGPPNPEPPYPLPEQVLPSELTLEGCKLGIGNCCLKQSMQFVPELEGWNHLVRTQFDKTLDEVETLDYEVVESLDEPLRPMATAMVAEALTNAREREVTPEALSAELMSLYEGTSTLPSNNPVAQALSPLIQRIKQDIASAMGGNNA